MTDFDNIDPNNNVGYWLFYAQRCVSYAFAEVMRIHCKEQGKPYVVTPPQWGVLSLLLIEDGLTTSYIGQKRGVDAPTMTGIIKRLEQSGLVERRHDREDRRVVNVYLTDDGRAITRSLLPVIQQFYGEMLCDFSQGEQQYLLSMLQRVVANLSNEALGTGDRFNLLPEHIVRQEFAYESRYPGGASNG